MSFIYDKYSVTLGIPKQKNTMYNVINWNNGLAFSSPFTHEVAKFIMGSMLAAYVDETRWNEDNANGWEIVKTLPATDWVAQLTPAQLLAPVVVSAPDGRKTRQAQYHVTVLTAGGWQLFTGGFDGTLPECHAWLAARVDGCAAYLKIYRAIKETGGVWSSAYVSAYHDEKPQPVVVMIASKQSIENA
jgi:hypothetical protein